MKIILVGVFAVGCLSGCLNLYQRIDREPAASPGHFQGLGDYLAAASDVDLYVMQIHGMGDNTAATDCGKESLNVKLQGRLADLLGYKPVAGGVPDPQPIIIGKTVTGTYSLRAYADDASIPRRRLYFACITWGETSRALKMNLLELDAHYDETNPNAAHRAPVNAFAKRFVNERFSDPVLYVGSFGGVIRDTVWQGMEDAECARKVQQQSLRDQAAARGAPASLAAGSFATVLITDSLGSRVAFDAICEHSGNCLQSESRRLAPNRAMAAARATLPCGGSEQDLSLHLQESIRSVYMLANQLPLLELAYLPRSAVDSGDLAKWRPGECYLPPPPERRDRAPEPPREIVAFTDQNDALSYYLTDRFRKRCASEQMPIFNVTTPNAKFRWLFAYSDLIEAHADGFKTNPDAVRYLVRGGNVDAR